MATKKFIIEVEDDSHTDRCSYCPCKCVQGGCHNPLEQYGLNCFEYNLATMKIKELEEEK